MGTTATAVSDTLLNALLSAATPDTNVPDELTRTILERGRRRILLAEEARFWQKLASNTGNANIGLFCGSTVDLEPLGVLGHLLRFSPTLRDAVEFTCRFCSLLAEELRLEFIEQDGHALLRASGPCGSALHPQGAEFAIAAIVATARALSPNFTPVEVRFPHAAPSDASTHERLFGCPVKFGCSSAEIVADLKVLDERLPEGNPLLCSVLERQARAQLNEMWPELEFLRQAERTYTDAFSQGETRLSALARELKVSSRTLQRKLRTHGTSHRDLLDRVRRQRAMALLLSSGAPLRVVARETGFAEPGAFCRAFRRWTGMSPGTYRRVSKHRLPMDIQQLRDADDGREGATH